MAFLFQEKGTDGRTDGRGATLNTLLHRYGGPHNNRATPDCVFVFQQMTKV